jgi:hypothetical protein
MKTKIIRKKLQDKSWVKKKYQKLLESANHLNTFKEFDCDPFFRGELLASHNLEIYERSMYRLERKLKFLKRYL